MCWFDFILSGYLSVCLSVYMKPVSENQSNSEHCQNYICWHRLPWGSLFLWLQLHTSQWMCLVKLRPVRCLSLSLNSVRTKNKRMSETNVDNFCLLRVETREITSSKQRNRWREALLLYIPAFHLFLTLLYLWLISSFQVLVSCAVMTARDLRPGPSVEITIVFPIVIIMILSSIQHCLCLSSSAIFTHHSFFLTWSVEMEFISHIFLYFSVCMSLCM